MIGSVPTRPASNLAASEDFLSCSLKSSQSITLLGDVRVEIRGRLERTKYSDVIANTQEFPDLHVLVSGTAVNMAVGAVGTFERIDVIAKVGADAFTPAIERRFADLGVTSHLVVDPALPNGCSVVLRDATPGEGVRLLVSSKPSPNLTLTTEELSAVLHRIPGRPVFVSDGYSLLANTSRAAVMSGARSVRDLGGLACLDVVPHDIDSRIAFADLAPALEAFQVVVCEAETLARMLGVDVSRPITSAEVLRLLPVVRRRIAGPTVWILRFGAGNMENVVMSHTDGRALTYRTGYVRAHAKTGFGDLILAKELRYILDVFGCELRD
jgi:sugar/nucleoside kinase (ribokinase family)